MRRVRVHTLLCLVSCFVPACGSSETSTTSPNVDTGVVSDARDGGGDSVADTEGDTGFSLDSGTDAPTDTADPCKALVDFETVPGSAPADGKTIDTQFQASNGVTFGLDKDGDGKPDPGAAPVLAKVGDPATAFMNDALGVGDTPAAGEKIGSYFLTDDGVISGPPSPLIITYAVPVAAAYGQILDIDGSEGWTIEARDAKGAVLESVVLKAGDVGTGDGRATPFSFKHASADIASIRVRYTGAATGGVGLGFDNFSPSCATPVLK